VCEGKSDGITKKQTDWRRHADTGIDQHIKTEDRETKRRGDGETDAQARTHARIKIFIHTEDIHT
jgi:hypothetical protein